MTITERLTDIRKHLGKSQKDLSTILGLSHSAWQAYESGKSLPGWEVLAGLYQHGIDINWVLTGEGGMKRGEGRNGGFSQFSVGDQVIQVGGKITGTVTQGAAQQFPDDVAELSDLLERYGNKTLKEELKARLLKLKADTEG